MRSGFMFPEHLWIEHAILISVCRFPSDSIGVFFIFLEQGRATGMVCVVVVIKLEQSLF
jgi:hypothetical protein